MVGQQFRFTIGKTKMNKIRLLIVFIILLIQSVVIAAQPLKLQWEAGVVDETHPAATGYKIYYSDDPANLSKFTIDVGNGLIYNLSAINLSYGVTYSFYVTAYNSTSESGPSNIIYFTWPSNPLLVF